MLLFFEGGDADMEQQVEILEMLEDAAGNRGDRRSEGFDFDLEHPRLR